MSREENVLRFYVLCNKLKDVIRTGWKNWHVKRNRIESVAEHIYSTQMLAIAIKSEYGYDNVDIMKVIYMLAIHELEEIIIGDLTLFDISREEKVKIGHEAVIRILSPLKDREFINAIILEFDARITPEAKFAYQVDKLECDLQCKLYDEEGCVVVDIEKDLVNIHDKTVVDLLKAGKSWSEMWMLSGQKRVNFDSNFLAISNYAINHYIKGLAEEDN